MKLIFQCVAIAIGGLAIIGILGWAASYPIENHDLKIIVNMVVGLICGVPLGLGVACFYDERKERQ